MAHVAFLGLGVMGYPMAGYLQKSDHQLIVYNRTQSKADRWLEEFEGKSATTPKGAVYNAEFVMACVGNDDDLRSIFLGENGALSGMAPGSIFVDHTTVSAKVTRELSDCARKAGVGYIDAPISGGQAGAEAGELVVMCGGDPDLFCRIEPLIKVYAKKCVLFGGSGAGQMAKMVNQICIAGLLQGLSEGLHFAEKAGLDAVAVIDVIAGGAAGSWQMANRHQTMLNDEFDHGFAVDWMRKDLKICLDTAEELHASLPVTALVDQFYKDVQRMNGGRWDTSSLFKRLQDFSGTRQSKD